ncbi:MAG: Mur ligase domain-containing protein, partial [Terrimicrobiaceae bacterium]|nr:Mur ligase domain-containing protein [Terrimicrobiaceae bacterium]
MKRQLGGLLSGVEDAVWGVPRETEVTGLSYHSGSVAPGEVFFALRGVKSDGAAYAREAVARGAAVV